MKEGMRADGTKENEILTFSQETVERDYENTSFINRNVESRRNSQGVTAAVGNWEYGRNTEKGITDLL